MDPPQRLNRSVQRQDALHGDPTDLLSLDPNAASLPKYLDIFPDDDSSEKLPPGLFTSAEANPPGSAHPPSSSRLQPVRPPPPPPKSRLLSACLPDTQGPGPPPVPPRSQMPLSKIQFSLDLPERTPRLTRSRTEVEHHVSLSGTFPDKELPLLPDRAHIPNFIFPTLGAVHHQTDGLSRGQHEKFDFFLCCNIPVRDILPCIITIAMFSSSCMESFGQFALFSSFSELITILCFIFGTCLFPFLSASCQDTSTPTTSPTRAWFGGGCRRSTLPCCSIWR